MCFTVKYLIVKHLLAAMGQLSLEKTFLLAAWAEALIYGFFFCIFSATMFIHFSPDTAGKRRIDRHGTVMIGISSVMFFIATFHLAMNCFRLLRGYVDHRLSPGGPVAYIGNLRPWDHILKDTLYATQENLGSAASIYRCWVLWNGDWRVILFPCVLLVVNFVAGYTVCGLYSSVDPTETVFDARLTNWIKTFYSIAVVLNIITTGLIAYRIWITHVKSSAYTAGTGRLLPILRIFVESAALQLIVETVLLALYCSDINAQYILLECVASIVGITFNAITIRIKLHTIAGASSSHPSSGTNPVQTIGSIPLRRIHVNITRDVEDHVDGYGVKRRESQDASHSEG
ncbi:hypothetical protein Hypma_008225 [Hypsizygus marmoreus]|uniref:Uncharacterized protein n=1 Tax=Hypsizygus marmoreus TaxID=39966 RepID=A0A369JYY7_HYPMA|nr:hypothetical protein Hypma_008225 [Hypsizygus marmoreus]